MLKLEKLVDYRIELLGDFYNGQRGEEITIGKTLSSTDTKKIERAIELGIVKKIGSNSVSNENAELDKAKEEIGSLNAELDKAKEESAGYVAEIITDIHKLNNKQLKEKYPLEE